jgi:hypothetical protein
MRKVNALTISRRPRWLLMIMTGAVLLTRSRGVGRGRHLVVVSLLAPRRNGLFTR